MPGENLSIIIKTILANAKESDLDEQIKALSAQIKERLELKLKIDASDLQVLTKQTEEVAKKLKTKTTMKGSQFINLDVEHQAFQEISSRIRQIKKEVNELAKVDINTNKKGQITSASLTYYNKELGKTITETMGWSEALKKVNGEDVKFRTFETLGTKYSDNMAKARAEAEKFVKQGNAVTQSLLDQKNAIERRDFNYGSLITGVNASAFGSSGNFSSYIKQQYGDSAELIGKFNDKQLKTGEILTQANFRVKEGSDKWRMYQATLNKTTGEMRLLDNGLKDVVNRQISFGEALKIAVTRISQWGIATSLVYGSLRKLRDGLETLKEIDSELINIAKVTNYTNQEMKGLVQTAVSAGQEFGRTAQEYLKAVTEFSRAGMGKQSEEYAKLSLLLQNVGDITAETANETLIATNAGFQLGGSYESLMAVIDKFNNISNLNATNINKLSEAMKVGASVFNAAGMSIDETIAIIGTATASTQRAGSEISRAWRTILMNIRQVADEEAEVTEESMKKAEKALNSVGIIVRDSPSTFRPMFDIITDLGNNWNNLTEVQQAYIAESLAGKRQANVLISTLQNFDMVQKQLNESIGASGSALRENEIYMNSWEAKAKQLSATATEFFSNAINTDAIKSLIDGLNSLVKILDVLINNSFSSALIQIVLLSTAVYGLGLGFKTLKTTAIANEIAFYSLMLAEEGLIVTTKALTATMWASPLFKIALATTAIYAIIKGIDTLTTSAKEAKEQLDELKSSVTTLSDELKNIEDLQQSYNNLSNKQNKSTEDKQKLLDVSKQIADLYPGIVSQYDSEGSAIEINSNKLSKYIKLKQEELQLKKEELAANFVANRNELSDSALSKPNISNWWEGKTTLTDWIKGTSTVDTLTKELDKYETALAKLKVSGEDSILVNGVSVDETKLEKEIAETRTLLNNALSEQRTSIQQYKEGLKASLDINDDFKDLNSNALNSFIESVGDNLKKLETTGNKVDGLDFVESLGKSQTFVDQFNKINIEFEQNKKNVNLTEDAYKQWHDEAVKSLSDIILYQGKIGSRSTANDIAKGLVDGLGEIKIATTEGTTALEQYEQAVSALGGVYKDSSASIKELQGFLDELNDKNKNGLSMESVNKMLESYPELIQYLGDEKTLREEITKRVTDYQNAIYDAFVLTKQYDTDFYNDVKNSHVDLFNQLAKLYDSNLQSWADLAQARKAIEENLISDLGNDWAKYFEAFQAGSLLVNATSGGDFRRLESGSALGVDSEQYAKLKGFLDFQNATRDIAAKFKNLNVSNSLAKKSSSSSSPDQYDEYALKDYQEAIQKADNALKLLDNDKSKLINTSKEYQEVIKKENALLSQKQILAHQEADRLRLVNSTIDQKIRSLSGIDWNNSNDTQRQSAYNALSTKNKKELNDLTKDYDANTKAILECQESYISWQKTIEENNFSIVTSNLSQFDKQLSILKDNLSTYKSQLELLFPTSSEYAFMLQKIIDANKEYAQVLKNKQLLTEKELLNDKLTILQKDELQDKLREINKEQIELQIELQNQLATLANEVVQIYKDAYEAQKDAALSAIDDEMDAEEKRHKQVTDNLDSELDQYKDIIQAKLDSIDKSESEYDYNKELTQLQKERQEIQNKLNSLSLDNSDWAKSQKTDLTKQLSEKDMEIQEKQHDRSIELQKDNLNYLLDSYEDQSDAKKKTEDDNYDAVKDSLNKQKKEVEKYWNNIINDDQKFANIRRNIIAGNLDGIQSDFDSFSSILSSKSKLIGENITNSLINKMKEITPALQAAKQELDDYTSINNGSNSNSSNNSNNSNNTPNNSYSEKTLTNGMTLREAASVAGVSVGWDESNKIITLNGKQFYSVPGTTLDSSGYNVVTDPELVKKILKSVGGTFHEGGVTGSGSSLVQKVSDFFNLKNNEVMIKSLVGELHIPENNVIKNFIPNMQNLISNLTPQISFAGVGGSAGDTIYNLNLRIDNVTGDKNGGQTVYNEIVKGLQKLGNKI